MKRAILILLAIIAFVGAAYSQTENPRGIYKLKSMLLDSIEIEAPFDQYKVCTDSVTLMVSVQEQFFGIIDNDHVIFDYTGEAPDENDKKRTRIFDSNAEKFTLKWWSTKATAFFPENDWCTEYYVSNSYSPEGKKVFDMLTSPIPTYDKTHPLFGAWHMVDLVDELNDAKKLCKEIKKNEPYRGLAIQVITSNRMINLRGAITDVERTDGKSFYQIKGQEEPIIVYMLSPNCFAVPNKRGKITDYAVWERVIDTRTPLEIIAGTFKR